MASGLSLCDDALLVDPLLRPCDGSSFVDPPPPPPGCSDLEAGFRAFLNQISSTSTLFKDPSRSMLPGFSDPDSPSASSPKSVCIDHSELFDIWLHKCYNKHPCSHRFPLCPDLKRSIEGLVRKILSERATGFQGSRTCFLEERVELSSSSGVLGGHKRRFTSPSDLLMWLKDAAIDPCNQKTSIGVEELCWQILGVREALRTDIADPQEYPYRKKRRSTSNLSSEKPNLELNQGLNPPMRRSKRCIEMLKIGKSDILRKRIPVGPEFQADVPDWTGPPNHSNVLDSDERWLGVRAWPVEGNNRENIEETEIGKGRPYLCSCPSPRSVACISSHVSAARLQLQSELGPAFASLGFDEMGEDVSRSWTLEEQLVFDFLVRQNPLSQGKSFWEAALTTFPSKSKNSVASYYFNVFVLRRMRNKTRLVALETIDSDDDESNSKAPEASYCIYLPRRSQPAINMS